MVPIRDPKTGKWHWEVRDILTRTEKLAKSVSMELQGPDAKLRKRKSIVASGPIGPIDTKLKKMLPPFLVGATEWTIVYEEASSAEFMGEFRLGEVAKVVI